MDEDLETCKIVRRGVRRAASKGDTESLFLSLDFMETAIPKSSSCRDEKISRQAAVAEERKREIDLVVDFFHQEIEAMRSAQQASFSRYFSWRLELESNRPRILKSYTDKRTGAVAWELYYHEIVGRRCKAYVRFKFFSSPRYGLPQSLDGDAWEKPLRTILKRQL